MIDILTHTNSLFKFSSDEISKISEKISGGRNYYTHYGNINKKTSYEETMVYNRYLHIVLLLIVYKIMGLSDEMLIKYIRGISFDNIKNSMLKYL